VANRRISEFPAIVGTDIVEQDLLTLVHVFEVDPVLRNKKITFTEFKEYLDQYYPNGSGGTFSGNVVINGNFKFPEKHLQEPQHNLRLVYLRPLRVPRSQEVLSMQQLLIPLPETLHLLPELL
jgi:hypothetical protein